MAQATLSCCCAAIHLEGGPGAAGAKKCPGDTFLARGRVPVGPNASRRDVGGPTALRRVTRKTSKPTAWRFFNEICPSGK